MQRYGAFETIYNWVDFERALRNAETANRALTAPSHSQGGTEGYGGRRSKRPSV